MEFFSMTIIITSTSRGSQREREREREASRRLNWRAAVAWAALGAAVVAAACEYECPVVWWRLEAGGRRE